MKTIIILLATSFSIQFTQSTINSKDTFSEFIQETIEELKIETEQKIADLRVDSIETEEVINILSAKSQEERMNSIDDMATQINAQLKKNEAEREAKDTNSVKSESNWEFGEGQITGEDSNLVEESISEENDNGGIIIIGEPSKGNDDQDDNRGGIILTGEPSKGVIVEIDTSKVESDTFKQWYTKTNERYIINKELQIEKFRLEKLSELNIEESISLFATEIKAELKKMGKDKPKKFLSSGRSDELKEIVKNHILNEIAPDIQTYKQQLENTQD